MKAVCSSLNQILNPEVSQELRVKFKREVDKLLEVCSPLRHEASLYASFVLRMHCENPVKFPIQFSTSNQIHLFYGHCLKRVLGEKVGAKSRENLKKLEEKNTKKKPKKETRKTSLQTKKRKLKHEGPRETKKKQRVKDGSTGSKKLKVQTNKVAMTEWLNQVEWPSAINRVESKKILQGYSRQLEVIAKQMATNCLVSLTGNVYRRLLSSLRLRFSKAVAVKLASVISTDDPSEKMTAILKTLRSKVSALHKETEKAKKADQKADTETDNKTMKKVTALNEQIEALQAESTSILVQSYRCKLFELPERESSLTWKQIFKHPAQILRFFFFLLGEAQKRRQEIEAKRTASSEKKNARESPKARLRSFHLVPYHGYSRFSLEIQHRVFMQIGVKIGAWKSSPVRKQSEQQKQECWEKWIHLSHLRVDLGKWKLHTHLHTDGVKASVMFVPRHATSVSPPSPAKQGKQKQKKEMKKIKGTKRKRKPKSAQPEPEPQTRIPLVPGMKGVWTDQEVSLDENIYDEEKFRVISVDPGRTNIVTANRDAMSVKVTRKEWNHWRQTLTVKRRQQHLLKAFEDQTTQSPSQSIFSPILFSPKYEKKGGKKETKRMCEKMEERMTNAEALQFQSEQCFYVQSSGEFLVQWQQRLLIEKQLRACYQTKTWRKMRFFSFQCKQSALRKVCLRILGEIHEDGRASFHRSKHPKGMAQRPFSKDDIKAKLIQPDRPRLVAYGAGKFPITQRGGSIAAAPLSSIPRALAQFPQTCVVMTDEYNTSKYCNACENRVRQCKVALQWKRMTKAETRLALDLTPKKREDLKQDRKVNWSVKTPHKLYKSCQKKACFHLLTCDHQECPLPRTVKTWRFRDPMACENIKDVCLARLLNRSYPKHFRRSHVIPWKEPAAPVPLQGRVSVPLPTTI